MPSQDMVMRIEVQIHIFVTCRTGSNLCLQPHSVEIVTRIVPDERQGITVTVNDSCVRIGSVLKEGLK